MSFKAKFMKNIAYLRLSDSRQFVASIVLTGSFLTSFVTAGAPAALAENAWVGDLSNFSVFLTAPAVDAAEEDQADLSIHGIGFVAVNSQPAAETKTSKKMAVVSQKTNGRKVIVTAYSSTADQTDSTPFITANGTYVSDGIIATNFLPFGTKVKFPEYSGDKVYTVQDRMAKKNSHKIDIWMPSRQLALNFGVKTLAYEIVE